MEWRFLESEIILILIAITMQRSSGGSQSSDLIDYSTTTLRLETKQ